MRDTLIKVQESDTPMPVAKIFATATRLEKVLIFKLGAFGDVIFCMVSMRRIRLYHPQAHITVLTSQPYATLFKRCPYVDEIVIDPRKPTWHIHRLIAVAKQLRRGGFDRIYDLQNDSRTRLYYRWALGTSIPYYCHPTDQELPLPEPPPAAIDLSPWMAEDVSSILRNHNISEGAILLIPGSSARHVIKRWPFFGSLAAQLTAEGRQVITAPGPDEIEYCRALPATLLLDNGRPLSLFQLAGLCTHASLVIGNDTGPTHLAARCGVATIALCGMLGMAERIGSSYYSAIFEQENMQSIPVAEVYQAASRILATYSPPA